MRAHRKSAQILAAGLVIVALTAVGVQAVGNDSTSRQTNYRGPARSVTGTGDMKLAGQVHTNRPTSVPLKPSIAHSHLPAMSNNPAFEQGGNSN